MGIWPWVHLGEETLLCDYVVADPRTLAGFPLGAAEDAEFEVARRWAFHVVAAVYALDCEATFAAILPAVFFGCFDKCLCFRVIGAVFFVRMMFAVALGTDFSVAFGTFTVGLIALIIKFDILGLDPCTTALGRAVETIFSGPLCILGVPKFSELALV